MPTVPMTLEGAPARRTRQLVGWLLAAGGALFLAGGLIHPNDDLPGASMAEQLRVMYEDPTWYPAHAAMFLGTALDRGGTRRAGTRSQSGQRRPRAHRCGRRGRR